MTDLTAAAAAFRRRVDAAAVAARATVVDKLDELTDDDVATVTDLFTPWAAGTAYTVGAVVQHAGVAYRCVQAHTSQADWTPDVVPALFAVVRQTAGPVVDPWVQPTGGHDAYSIGDRVTHNGSTWESTADANVWEPGVFGWTAV